MRRARWKVCGMGAVFSHYHDSKPRQFLNSPPRQDARADSLRRPKQNATGPGLNDWSGSSVLREPIRDGAEGLGGQDRKSTRLNSSHVSISYAVFCLKKKKQT